MKTIAEQLIQLNQIKSDIKQAIISKGVAVSDDDGFESYADKVSQIRVQTITFKINNVTYEALPNMTWREWRFSDYNTAGLWVYHDENYTTPLIVIREGIYPIRINNSTSGQTEMKASDLIVSGAQYVSGGYLIDGDEPVWE
jgi:hypothetical protein